MRQRTLNAVSEGEAQTDTRPKVIVFRSVDKIVTRVREQTDVWCKPIFETNADVPQYFIVRTAAIEVILVSHRRDPSESVVLVEDSAYPAKRVGRQMKAWECGIQWITQNNVSGDR